MNEISLPGPHPSPPTKAKLKRYAPKGLSERTKKIGTVFVH